MSITPLTTINHALQVLHFFSRSVFSLADMEDRSQPCNEAFHSPSVGRMTPFCNTKA